MSLCKEILLPHGIDNGTDAFPVASGVTLQQGSRREIFPYLSFPFYPDLRDQYRKLRVKSHKPGFMERRELSLPFSA